MNIQLKAKHLFLILREIKSQPIDKYGRLYNSLLSQLVGITDKESLVTVDGTADNLIELYTAFGNKENILIADIAKEMRDLLTPQITNGYGAGNADWIKVAQYVQGIDTARDAQLNQMIAEGEQIISAQ